MTLPKVGDTTVKISIRDHCSECGSIIDGTLCGWDCKYDTESPKNRTIVQLKYKHTIEFIGVVTDEISGIVP